MTVTVDLATEDVRTLTTSPQTFSHGGAASGVKGVVLAIVHGASSTDHVSAASYGGVALTRKQRNIDTANEAGAAELWFLGEGVPQGTQTVSYTPGSTGDDIHAVCITLLAAADLEVIDQDGIDENVANPSVTLQYASRSSMSFAALYGGGADGSAFTPNANCTTVHDHDLGAFYSEVIRQTTAGTADFAIGGTSSTDDVAFAAITVSEVVASNNTTIVAAQGSYVLTGQAALFKQEKTLIAAQGSYAYTGQAVWLQPSNIEGYFVTEDGDPLTTEDDEWLVTEGFVAQQQIVITAAQGSYALTGYPASMKRAMLASPGSYILTGQLAQTVKARSIAAAQGSYALTGQAALSRRTMLAGQGSYLLTGQAISAKRALQIAQGAYALTGQAALFKAGHVITAVQGAYALTGQAALFKRTYTLPMAHGAYVLTGQDVLFLEEEQSFITAEQGGYTLSGQDAFSKRAYTLAASQGNYSLSGQALTFSGSRRIVVGQGSYSHTGQAINLTAQRMLAADGGIYALTGQEMAFQMSSSFMAEHGVYNLFGQDVTLVPSFRAVRIYFGSLELRMAG